MSRLASTLPLLVAVTLGSCKLARNEEQTGRDLPPPEPAASNAPSKPQDLPAPPPRPRDPDRPATRPAATASEPAAKPTPTPEAPEPTATAPATPAPTPTAAGAAGAAPTLNTSCLPKCQATLQSCVSKPPALDGGLPSLESLAECRQAFDDCRKECGI